MSSPIKPSAQIKNSLYKPQQQMTDAKVAKTAKDFEAMTIGQLLSPMMETLDDKDDVTGHGSDAEKQFRSLQVQELGKQISNAGGIGIAKQVYKKMKEMQTPPQKTHIINEKH